MKKSELAGITSRILTVFPVFIFLFTAWIYWPGLDGGLILDDMPNLRVLMPLETGDKDWQSVLAELNPGIHSRPVSMLSFFINFVTTGSDIWFLKFTNLLIHLVCGVFIYFLSRILIMRAVADTGTDTAGWIALWITAVWLLAPLHVSTTLYVIQRMAQLPALFIFAGLLMYVTGRQKIESGHKTGYRYIGIAFLCLWPLAIFSKENGAIFPLLVLLIELYFFRSLSTNSHHRRFLAGLLVLVIVPALILLMKIMLQPEWLVSQYGGREFSVYERLLTQPRILFDYTANLLMIPGGSGMGLFHDDFIKSTGLFFPPTTLLSIAGVAGCVVAAFKTFHTRYGAISFGILFYLAAHSIESGIFPLEMYFEHRNYLPSYGLFFSLGVSAGHLLTQVRLKKIIMFMMIFIVVSYSFFTFLRVDIWRSWDSILLSSELHHPDSLRVQRGLAIVYIFRSEFSKAVEHIEKADRLDNEKGDAGIAMKYLMAHCYAQLDAPDRIYTRLRTVNVFPNDYYTGSLIEWLVDSIESGVCNSINIDTVITILDELFSNKKFQRNYTSNPESHVFMARLKAYRHQTREAIWHLEQAARLKPDSVYIDKLLREYKARSQTGNYRTDGVDSGVY